MNAEVKNSANFRSVYMKEKSELNTLRQKEKLSIVWKRKDMRQQIVIIRLIWSIVKKVEEFCKAAEKEEQAAVDIVVVFDEGGNYTISFQSQ